MVGKGYIVVLWLVVCTGQLDRSYLQAGERVKFFFLNSRPGFKPVIQCECWFWQCISARGNLMFATPRVRLLVWPHFGASTSETGHMSHQPMSNVPSRTFQYGMTTVLSKREVQQSLEHTMVLPLVALFQGSGAVWLWLLRCLTKHCPHWPGRVISHKPLSDWLT